jgi:hypothetical protein
LQHPVLLRHVENSVAREADAVRDLERDRWRELLDLVGNPILVAIRDGIDVALAGADKDHAGIRADGHVTRIRHNRIEIDLKTGRELDLLKVLPYGIGATTFLRYRPRLGGSGALER